MPIIVFNVDNDQLKFPISGGGFGGAKLLLDRLGCCQGLSSSAIALQRGLGVALILLTAPLTIVLLELLSIELLVWMLETEA